MSDRGGRDNCEMRACAESKKISGCYACSEIAVCKHSELLNYMRSGAIKAGLFVTTEDVDGEQFIRQWTARLRASWPASVLFAKG